MGRLDGRVALITGGSGGIGRATALELARDGAQIAVQYRRNRDAADRVVNEIATANRKAVAVRCDVSKQDECRDAVASVLEAFGRLDAVVCFAGHPFARDEWFKDFAKLQADEFQKPLDVDLLGCAYIAQAAIPAMVRREKGSIVFIGSTPALTGDSVGIPFLVAKAGVLALTRALAMTYGPNGIRVNALALGSIETEAMNPLTPAERKALAEEPALKRWGRPEEVARAVAFLVSDDASYITGTTLIVDGGYALR